MRPVVGVGIVVEQDKKIPLGLRIEKNGKELWSLPGGKLEKYETIHECAPRELREESGLVAIGKADIFCIGNIIDKELDLHTITIGMVISSFFGVLVNNEPAKFKSWQWFSLDALPSPLFLPTGYVLAAYCKLKQYSFCIPIDAEYGEQSILYMEGISKNPF